MKTWKRFTVVVVINVVTQLVVATVAFAQANIEHQVYPNAEPGLPSTGGALSGDLQMPANGTIYNSSGSRLVIDAYQQLTLIAGTSLALQINAAQFAVGTYAGFRTLYGGMMLNEVPSATNPTIVPEYSDVDSGLSWVSADVVGITAGAVQAIMFYEASNEVQAVFPPCTFANLGTPADNRFCYCSDCAKATPCAGSGTGALAKRLNGAWDCD